MKKEYDFSKVKRRPITKPLGKTRVSIYLDDDVIESFRAQSNASGNGFQSLINEVLIESVLNKKSQANEVEAEAAEMQRFQEDLLESVRQMKRGEAARTTIVDDMKPEYDLSTMRSRPNPFAKSIPKAIPKINDLVSRHPEIVSGALVFAGTRLLVKNLFDYIEGGNSLNEFLEDFDSITKEHAVAVIEAAHYLLSTYRSTD